MPVESLGNVRDKLRFWQQNRLPVLLQSEAAECGLACLAMIADYYGNHSSLIGMRQQFSLSLRGATLHDLIQFAERLNFSSRPLRIELADLANLATPCILHWDMNHFVVLKSASSRGVIVHDPAFGERRMSMDEVSRHFTGIALELRPTKEFQRVAAPRSLRLSDFWQSIHGLKRSLGLIFLLSCILQLFVLAAPYYMQIVIDDVVLTGNLSLLTVLGLGFFLLLVFEVVTSALRGLALLHLGSSLNIQLGANLFHHLIRLPMQFFEKRHMGDIVSRFGSLQQIRQLLTTGLTAAIIDGMMTITTFALMLVYSATLSFVVLAALALYLVVRLATYQSFRNISEQEISAKAEENSNFMETVRGIQAIKLFGAELKREGLWQNRFASAINQNIRLGNFSTSFTAINRLLFGTENILVVYLAARMVVAGDFTIGMLVAFMAYKLQFMTKAGSLIEKLIEFKMLGLHFDRLSDIVLTEREKQHGTITRPVAIKGRLSLRSISYRYSDATPNVLSNISLDIAPGEAVAITGPSGCGKSTLLKLMVGLNTPTEGEIYIDDIPLSQIGGAHYRRQIAVVMQNDDLLSGSVAENIAFFEHDYDIERIQQCAQLAAIHDDIVQMPMGYNSLVGDMGASLSGGQKQRIILARALYRQPKILFMDEATSHLDSKLEADINKAVKALDMTRVIVAHREETIRSADREINLAALHTEQTEKAGNAA
jgi:ATP-binding cassette subfamily B protein RaxB